MDIERAVAVLGIACYVASSLLAVASLVGNRPRGERFALAFMTVGAALLAAVLASRGIGASAIPAFNRFEALTCYVLALSGAYLLLIACRRICGIAGILIPYATVILLGGASGIGADAGTPVPVPGPWLALHVLTAYAAYGVFTLASINAAAYLLQDNNLKRKRLGAVWERLPALETLDHVMSRLAGLAFLLLTVAIALGVVLVRNRGVDEWITDPKVVATAAAWIVLAVFVHMRATADRHGRGVALMALGGLLCLLFAFMGIHLVAVTAHPFVRPLPWGYGP